jgi:hypothetical protein
MAVVHAPPIAEVWRLLMRFIGFVTFVTAALSCTSGRAQELPLYSSSNDYRKFTCAELAQEGRTISKRGFMLSGLKAGLGGSDSTETTPAIVMVWPATSATGDRQQSENLALALMQMEAVEQASMESQCSIRFQRPPAS